MIQIDMPMPYNCSECRFKTEYEFCKAKPDNFCGNTNDKVRPEWCPLKEQEAVEPTLIREGRNKNYNDYVCPRCDNDDLMCMGGTENDGKMPILSGSMRS